MSYQYHMVVRTSPKGEGQTFIGKCVVCGAEGLTTPFGKCEKNTPEIYKAVFKKIIEGDK